MANVKQKIEKGRSGKQKSFHQLKQQNKFNKSRRRTSPQDEVMKQKIEARKVQRAEKIAKAKAEKERALREKAERVRIYKNKRLEKTKVISKKTKHGQPLMKDRMQLLLKQIEEMKRIR